jgi:transposase
MARPVAITEDDISRAHSIIENTKDTTELFQALVVLLISDKRYSTLEVCKLLHISKTTAFNYLALLHFPEKASEKPQGGRRNSRLTLEEEVTFLKSFEEQALNGEVVSAAEIHAKLVEHLDKPVALSTTYRLLERNNWRKIKPDTRHPKSSPEIQEEFKKKHSKYEWKKFL